MSNSSARMLIFTLVILLMGMVGCISDKSSRSTRDTTHSSEMSSAVRRIVPLVSQPERCGEGPRPHRLWPG